ncbi:RNA-directed DNA polymerase, eukaryota, partial [Tanacetum coccineum]
MENKPALVLDNSCLNQHDYSNFLIGKVKDFESLSNLKVVLGKVFWVWAKEILGWVPDFVKDNEEETDTDDEINGEESNEDPFSLYFLLNKKKDDNNKRASVEDSLKFPTGFTPKDVKEATKEHPNMSNESKRVSGEGFHSIHEEETAFGVKKYCSKKKAKDDVAESICSCHFQKAETPRSGGSILQLMDDMVKNWNGRVVIMGDFNEFRKKTERFGLVFNVQGADAFSMFISNAGLEDVPLAVSLDRYLSDHCSILMHESRYDYGPVPFRFFHYWFDMEGFEKLVEDSWKEAPVEDINALIKMMKKLKYLKEKIHMWNQTNKEGFRNSMRNLKDDLAELDLVIDKGE